MNETAQPEMMIEKQDWIYSTLLAAQNNTKSLKMILSPTTTCCRSAS